MNLQLAIKKISRIKGVIKTLDNIFFPEHEQTEDNAYSKANKFENKVLTEEFKKHQANLSATMELLKEYVYSKAITEEGLLLTEKDKTARAEAFYNDLLQSNFIHRGLLSRHVIDEIKNVAEQFN